mmetsp:Transcript_20788/g.57474  ORF Transcript_20788/g.57474 Transcript_20788/m.57474 type:complete len:360 (-) Transcript_20788:113-1192(-)|eukprot:CAMPEP_0168748954 /NCGR_PEP_ID=MMETSP0724-20121128/16449_1 /TAXON_ID=265536 /ORGANISM="Amphiprora sp., Strain CCMP467" /LENGTH=359 /DNA_ID=CAMNT_0008796813 /DNA_START=77 /DNA_END=1156 /DNA_ORIENTATION=-
MMKRSSNKTRSQQAAAACRLVPLLALLAYIHYYWTSSSSTSNDSDSLLLSSSSSSSSTNDVQAIRNDLATIQNDLAQMRRDLQLPQQHSIAQAQPKPQPQSWNFPPDTDPKIALPANCPLNGSTKPPADRIVLSRSRLGASSHPRLQEVKRFTKPSYETFLSGPPGREHYTLLHYLASTYGRTDCRHLVDVGTRFVASSLALAAAAGHMVVTVDLPGSTERRLAFRGRTQPAWIDAVREAPGVVGPIQFKNVRLLEISTEDFTALMSTWLISLDTYHKPRTAPFERAFLERLRSLSFQGLLLLDDIHLNDEMKEWWTELQEHATEWGYRAFDITHIGHYSGTGLLDFSGTVVVEDAVES